MASHRSFLISDDCLNLAEGPDPAEVDDSEYIFWCLPENDVACAEPGGFIYNMDDVVLLIIFRELYQIELAAFIEVIRKSYRRSCLR